MVYSFQAESQKLTFHIQIFTYSTLQIIQLLPTTKSEFFCVSFMFLGVIPHLRGNTMLYKYMYNAVTYNFEWFVLIFLYRYTSAYDKFYA